jgi:chromosome segregation ATPase
MSRRFQDLRARLEVLEAEITKGTRDNHDAPTNFSHHRYHTKEMKHPMTHKNRRVRTNNCKPRFQATINPTNSVLHRRPDSDAAAVASLLARLREVEAQRVSERGSLQLAAQKERQRAHRAEEAARQVSERLDFREGEVRHLKAALKRRDDMVTALQDQVRELEIGIAHAAKVQELEGRTGWVGLGWLLNFGTTLGRSSGWCVLLINQTLNRGVSTHFIVCLLYVEVREKLNRKVTELQDRLAEANEALDVKDGMLRKSQASIESEKNERTREARRADNAEDKATELFAAMQSQKEGRTRLQAACQLCTWHFENRKGMLQRIVDWRDCFSPSLESENTEHDSICSGTSPCLPYHDQKL